MAYLNEIKQKMISSPEAIIELLEAFDFCHINLRPNEIRFARDEQAGQNIRIRLQNNDWLNVEDFSRAVRSDIFSYIIQEKSVTFRDVLQQTKKLLGLDDHWRPQSRRLLFGGVYEKISKQNDYEAKVYDESVLNQYRPCCNKRFLRDHITLSSQKKFGVGYNVSTQRISIPIRNIYGDLCGVKCRRNYETDNEDDPKYIYEVPAAKSLLLYGAHENYEHLMGAERIVIGESEKFVLACDSYGYHSAVSIMGSTLSIEQAKQLLSFNAKEYCFMLDQGLDLSVTLANANTLKACASMREIQITFFDWRESLCVGEKESPTDNGKDTFYYILEHEIKSIENLTGDIKL